MHLGRWRKDLKFIEHLSYAKSCELPFLPIFFSGLQRSSTPILTQGLFSLEINCGNLVSVNQLAVNIEPHRQFSSLLIRSTSLCTLQTGAKGGKQMLKPHSRTLLGKHSFHMPWSQIMSVLPQKHSSLKEPMQPPKCYWKKKKEKKKEK